MPDHRVAANSLVVVFAKYPEPGRVKTRLIGCVSDEQAAAIHAACLQNTLRIVSQVDSADSWLAVAPDDADFSDIVGDGIEIRPQGGGDLGERLARMAEQAFGAGYGRVALVGCDCPTMTARDIQRAFAALDRDGVAIGPAADGGYYLLAMRGFVPALFRDIEWSSSRVLAQTRTRAEASGLTVAILDTRSDLDRPADLEAMLADDAADGDVGALRETIRRITSEGESRVGN